MFLPLQCSESFCYCLSESSLNNDMSGQKLSFKTLELVPCPVEKLKLVLVLEYIVF